MLVVECLTKIVSEGHDNLLKVFTGRFWLAVADLLSCWAHNDGEADISGQDMVGQAGPGTLASSDGTDSTASQRVLGVTNVHVDAVVL